MRIFAKSIGEISFVIGDSKTEELFRELNTLRKLLCTSFALQEKFPILSEFHQLLENELYSKSIDE